MADNSKENLEKFIRKHHDDGTGKPEELNRIKEIKKKKEEKPKMSSDKMRDDDSPYGGHLDRSENALTAHGYEADDEDDYLEAVHKHKYDMKAHQKLHDEVDKMHKAGKEVPNEMLSKLKQHTQKSINVLHRV